MAADMSGEQMQAKITAARREAEGLKDKIRRRKDDLADTNCMSSPLLPLLERVFDVAGCPWGTRPLPYRIGRFPTSADLLTMTKLNSA